MTLLMEDERHRAVPLVVLDREGQPILVLHQYLDGSVVMRAHALSRDENRQPVKGPGPKIRNGVLPGKRRLEGDDRSIDIAKSNLGARPIEVRLSLTGVGSYAKYWSNSRRATSGWFDARNRA